VAILRRSGGVTIPQACHFVVGVVEVHKGRVECALIGGGQGAEGR